MMIFITDVCPDTFKGSYTRKVVSRFCSQFLNWKVHEPEGQGPGICLHLKILTISLIVSIIVVHLYPISGIWTNSLL
jgi:hypothetical protein